MRTTIITTTITTTMRARPAALSCCRVTDRAAKARWLPALLLTLTMTACMPAVVVAPQAPPESAAVPEVAAPDPREAEAELRAAAVQWWASIASRDVAAAARFLAPEFSLMAPALGEMPRQQWLDLLPQYELHDHEYKILQLQVYGDAGMIRSQYRQHATVRGQDRSGMMLVTDVWARRHGSWQVVARHTSWLDR